MAKNYVQRGGTITFIADSRVVSGEMVPVGDIVAVAVTDVAENATGTGIVEGVFIFPKLQSDDIKKGKKVYLKEKKVQLSASGAAAGVLYAGIAWDDAGTDDEHVLVKINV